MFKISIRGLIAHKLRLVLSALAVVLGVAFITGTYVLTDSSRATFDNLFTQVFSTVDLAVRNPPPFGDSSSQQQRRPVPQGVAAEVAAVPGVAAADGQVFGGPLVILDRDGKALKASGPIFGTNAPVDDASSPYNVEQGRWPRSTDEVVVDKATAKRAGFAVGDPIRIAGVNPDVPTASYRLTGLFTLGEAANFGGASIAVFDTETAQLVLNREGEFDQVFVRVDEGQSPSAVATRIEQRIGPKYDVVTGADVTGENLDAINQFLSIFEKLLLGFALIGLFVGTFIIFNTFSMVVAQRTREMALVRALGASRSQVVGSVLTEALLVGAIASLIGIAAGYGLAALLQWFLERQDFAPPNGQLVLHGSRVAIALAVGIGVTVVSAVFPAVRASQVPPLAAIRRAEQTASARHPGWTWFGFAAIVVGIVFLASGLGREGGDKFEAIGLGAALVIIGMIAIAARIARPVTRVVGRLVRRGFTGQLAYQNAQRSPRRTAVTASALMVGLTLVSVTLILASSVSESIRSLVSSTFEADLTLSTDFGEFTPAAAQEIREIDGVEVVASIRQGQVKIGGKVDDADAVDAVGVDRLIRLDTTDAARAAFAQGGLLIYADRAAQEGWQAGDRLAVRFPADPKKVVRIPIAGTFDVKGFFDEVVMPMTVYDQHFVDKTDLFALVGAAEGRTAQVRRDVEALVKKNYPNIKVQDQEEFTRDQERQVTQLLFIFFALLFLSLLIAGIGVMNTMALSVFERTQELGLLRAVGMSRRQVRSMIRKESVIICVFGALLGVVLGVALGTVVVEALGEFNIKTLSIPPVQLVLVVVAAGLLGVVASLFPARRAARLDILDAISTE